MIDSGSTDGSLELARRHGARVVGSPRAEFWHGRTRNRLMELAAGDHVAFLTQDSAPPGERWLAALLAASTLADDVALVARPLPPAARRQPDGPPRAAGVLRGVRRRAGRPRRRRRRPAAFFSSANGAVARWAWERVPFRPVPYAEDQQLARDVLAAASPRPTSGRGGRALARPPAAARAAAATSTTSGRWRRCTGHREPMTPRYSRRGCATTSPPTGRSCAARARRGRRRLRSLQPPRARGRSAAAWAATPTGCRPGCGADCRSSGAARSSPR